MASSELSTAPAIMPGDMVLLQGCEQPGEVLHAGWGGRLLVRLPLLDAVILAHESDLERMSAASLASLDRELQDQERDAAAYLQTLAKGTFTAGGLDSPA